MFTSQISALVMHRFLTSAGSYQVKGKNTPFVLITKLYLQENKSFPSESFSFFYKQLRQPAMVERHLEDLQSAALTLTAKAMKKIYGSLPVDTKAGRANILRLTKTEFIIVAVIADDEDKALCCNYLASEISQLK